MSWMRAFRHWIHREDLEIYIARRVRVETTLNRPLLERVASDLRFLHRQVYPWEGHACPICTDTLPDLKRLLDELQGPMPRGPLLPL